ncbi:hypothetical protein GGR54DRAFT_139728 [Hypoxylon sp. NC1633]|nr:hypothetical protein GGR54DRAFT_139728 [Hypoxylon sp. NC1633]
MVFYALLSLLIVPSIYWFRCPIPTLEQCNLYAQDNVKLGVHRYHNTDLSLSITFFKFPPLDDHTSQFRCSIASQHHDATAGHAYLCGCVLNPTQSYFRGPRPPWIQLLRHPKPA